MADKSESKFCLFIKKKRNDLQCLKIPISNNFISLTNLLSKVALNGSSFAQFRIDVKHWVQNLKKFKFHDELSVHFIEI